MDTNGGRGGVLSNPEESASTDSDEGQRKRLDSKKNLQTLSTLDIRATPWFVWPVFVVSILVGSSSATITKLLHRAAPISLAGWRHQISSVLLLPCFIWQWTSLAKSERAKTFQRDNLLLHLGCAITLALHFATYLWSLDHTSMTHCLFLTCMSPIFVTLYTRMLGGTLLRGEIVGVSLGLVGTVILGAGTRVEDDNSSSHVGDLLALLSAASFAAYLTVGRRIRSWMPLFVFQFPVTVAVAIMLGVAGLLLEGWNESDVGEISGPFGWTRKEYLPGTVALAVGPGILGQAGYSTVIRYSSALLMPTGLSLQPILGSLLGWAVGETPIPGLWTCVGALVTLIGTLSVSYASEHHQAKLKANSKDYDKEYREPASAQYEGQEGTKPLLEASDIP